MNAHDECGPEDMTWPAMPRSSNEPWFTLLIPVLAMATARLRLASMTGFLRMGRSRNSGGSVAVL